MLVIVQFKKSCPAKRSLIVWRIWVNRRMKTRSVNGGVSHAQFEISLMLDDGHLGFSHEGSTQF